jgi:hypothetical protein
MRAASARAMMMAAASALKASLADGRGSTRVLLMCVRSAGAEECNVDELKRKAHARDAVARVPGDRESLRGVSRSGHTDTGATEHATRHATERGSVRRLHVYEAMGAPGQSQGARLKTPWLDCLRFQFSVVSSQLPVLSVRANLIYCEP